MLILSNSIARCPSSRSRHNSHTDAPGSFSVKLDSRGCDGINQKENLKKPPNSEFELAACLARWAKRLDRLRWVLSGSLGAGRRLSQAQGCFLGQVWESSTSPAEKRDSVISVQSSSVFCLRLKPPPQDTQTGVPLCNLQSSIGLHGNMLAGSMCRDL